MQSKLFAALGGIILYTSLAVAAVGEKRTLLTSGEKVHTIRYQLGQSTVIYFGMKPETVICGNKNYFHIDKLKEGITIQALSNFSTNLTVLSQGKRFLFYLTPSSGQKSDSFVEVRWVPPNEVKRLMISSSVLKQVVRKANGRLFLNSIELNLIREISVPNSKRTILEFEIKNSKNELVKTSEIQMELFRGSHQTLVFDTNQIAPGATSKGRLIAISNNIKNAVLKVKYRTQIGTIQGVLH